MFLSKISHSYALIWPFLRFMKIYTILHLNESYITDLEEKEEHYAACYIWVEREGKDEEDDI